MSQLKRKVSLRDSWVRKLKAAGTKIIYGRNGRTKKRKPLKKISRSQRTRSRAYFALTAAFLERPENQHCQICVRRREAGEDILLHQATEVHHRRGRIGRLLTHEPEFVPSCFECRQWPHQHPRKARELGLLAPVAQWNVFPVDGN